MGNGTSKGSSMNMRINMLAGNGMLKSQWRQMSWDEQARHGFIDAIKDYKPLSQVGVSHSNILLLGAVNVGKSSFFNTINSIFRNHVTAQAPVGSPMDDASITTRMRGYQVRNGREGKVLNFRIVDTMGLEEQRKQGFDHSELPYILDGHVPDNHQFDTKGNISPDMPGFIKIPSLQNKMHCCVFILEASSIPNLGEGILYKLSQMRSKITNRGIPLIVLLTKIDEACHNVKGDVSLVYRSAVIQSLVKQASVKIGIPVSYILPVKNYTHELELDPWVDLLALSAVQQMLRFTDNFFDECLAGEPRGYVPPERRSADLWTQNATMPEVQNGRNQMWSSNGVRLTPNNEARDHKLDESLSEVAITENGTITAKESEVHTSGDVHANGDANGKENGSMKVKDLDYIPKSPSNGIDGGYAIPGQVPQEAA